MEDKNADLVNDTMCNLRGTVKDTLDAIDSHKQKLAGTEDCLIDYIEREMQQLMQQTRNAYWDMLATKLEEYDTAELIQSKKTNMHRKE